MWWGVNWWLLGIFYSQVLPPLVVGGIQWIHKDALVHWAPIHYCVSSKQDKDTWSGGVITDVDAYYVDSWLGKLGNQLVIFLPFFSPSFSLVTLMLVIKSQAWVWNNQTHQTPLHFSAHISDTLMHSSSYKRHIHKSVLTHRKNMVKAHIFKCVDKVIEGRCSNDS